MLFAFILFGAVLSTLVGTVPLAATLALAAVTLFVARPAAVAIVLRHAAVSRSAQRVHRVVRPTRPRVAPARPPRRPGGLPGAETILGDRGRRRHRLGDPPRHLRDAADGGVRAEGGAGDARRGARQQRARPAAVGTRSLSDELPLMEVEDLLARLRAGRPPAHPRRALALELREGPGRDPGSRARPPGPGRELGGQAHARSGDRRLLHLTRRSHQRPCGADAAEDGIRGVGPQGRARGLARGDARRARQDAEMAPIGSRA